MGKTWVVFGLFVSLCVTLAFSDETTTPAAGTPSAWWSNTTTARLSSVEPYGSAEDLEPLIKWIGQAEIVGLGEMNHGTSEFFQFKHRFFEALVEKAGFTVFALEASHSVCERINQWVLGGEGDPKALLALTGHRLLLRPG